MNVIQQDYYFHAAWQVRINQHSYLSSEVTTMDLFWNGLAKRASEQTWNERKSQFSKVHEIIIQDIEAQKRSAARVSN